MFVIDGERYAPKNELTELLGVTLTELSQFEEKYSEELAGAIRELNPEERLKYATYARRVYAWDFAFEFYLQRMPGNPDKLRNICEAYGQNAEFWITWEKALNGIK